MKLLKEQVVKWSGWVVAFLLLSGLFYQAIVIRKQLAFTVTNPKAVSTCMEGYLGEHLEADKRFEQKQRGVLVSPLADEAKKE